MNALYEVAAAADSSSQTDYTPALIGLAGALVGALIGLQFNLWSHRTERKRHIRERVSLLIEQTDVVLRFFDEERRQQASILPSHEGSEEKRPSAEEVFRRLDASMDEARRVLGYLSLTDHKGWYAAQLVFDAAYDLRRGIGFRLENSTSIDYEAYLNHASHLYQRSYEKLVELVGQKPPHPLGPTIAIRKLSSWSARRLGEPRVTFTEAEKADGS